MTRTGRMLPKCSRSNSVYNSVNHKASKDAGFFRSNKTPTRKIPSRRLAEFGPRLIVRKGDGKRSPAKAHQLFPEPMLPRALPATFYRQSDAKTKSITI